MTHKHKTAAQTFLKALCLSASFIVPASAAEVVFLPDIPADQIARDTVRSFDSRTGVSLITAPTFDPFEQDSTLAGTASLRTGPSETAIDGTRVVGGAYLDLKMIYTSPSDDPYDLRGYERAYYVSGDEVSRIRQDVRTLDCASNTSEVIYQDNYYDSFDSYGYLAGLYLLLPRYRGHRGYWNSNSRHRPYAGWSDWRYRGGFGSYSGGGYYAGRNGGSRGYNSRGHNNRGQGGRGTGHNSGHNGGNTTDNVRAPRPNAGASVIGGSAVNREYRPQRGVVTGGPLRTREGQTTNTPQGQRSTGQRTNEELSDAQRADAREQRRNRIREDRHARDRAVRRDSDRGNNPAANIARQPIIGSGRPAISETTGNRRANPAGSPPSTVARQAPPTPVSRPAPISRAEPISRPAPVSRPAAPRTESRSRSNSSPARSSRNINREVDRSFRNTNRAERGKRLDFFPMLGGLSQVSRNIITNYRCVREETVTLHIPQDRLDAARFDGMTLVIVDNADRDVPIYLPPNYIEGFRQAARQGGYSSQSTVVTPQQSYVQPSYSPPDYQDEYQGGYPQN